LRFIVILFIAVPLIEMLLLFEVSDVIGGLNTLGLVVLTAVIGVQILKRQGLNTLLRANQRLESGQLPAQEITEGMLLAAAGALLLTPGFITDCIGFVFLTGPLRRRLARRIVHSGVVQAGAGRSQFTFWTSTSTRRPNTDGRNRGPGRGKIYEGEYSDADRDSIDGPDSEDRPH